MGYDDNNTRNRCITSWVDEGFLILNNEEKILNLLKDGRFEEARDELNILLKQIHGIIKNWQVYDVFDMINFKDRLYN